MTTQLTPQIDMTDRSMLNYGATVTGERDTAADRLGATPTGKDQHIFEQELRQSRSYRQHNSKDLDWPGGMLMPQGRNRERHNATQDLRESAEADDEAMLLVRQSNKFNLRASRDERIHTSRFGKNGFEALQSKAHKMEEQSESSGKLKPKHSEEPTWAKRVLRSPQRTAEFKTLQPDRRKGQTPDGKRRPKFRFIYPVEHLQVLKRQKSPYGRSRSANIR